MNNNHEHNERSSKKEIMSYRKVIILSITLIISIFWLFVSTEKSVFAEETIASKAGVYDWLISNDSDNINSTQNHSPPKTSVNNSNVLSVNSNENVFDWLSQQQNYSAKYNDNGTVFDWLSQDDSYSSDYNSQNSIDNGFLRLSPLKEKRIPCTLPIYLINEDIIIGNLRRYYNSPAKSLSRLIAETRISDESLPVYSYKDQSSYVRQQPSQTKENKKSQSDVVNWLIDEENYSKFHNDPLYSDVPAELGEIEVVEYDYSDVETAIVSLRINNKVAYDFEIIIWPDGTVSVPIKTLAKLLDIQVNQNHATQIITFTSPANNQLVTVYPKDNKITVDTTVIQVKKPDIVFMPEGFIVEDDIFIPEKIANDLLDVNSKFLKENYVINLSTTRTLKAFVSVEDSPSSSSAIVEEDRVTVEEDKENKLFSLKKLSYNFGSSVNQSSGGTGSDGNANVQAGLRLIGNLLGGEYTISSNLHHGENGMVISGYRASLDYVRPKYELSLGGTNAVLSDLVVPSANVWGFRLGSVGAANNTHSIPRLIEGAAEDNTYVELYINNVYSDKQLVKDARYLFDSLVYPKTTFVNLRVEQVNQDGSRTIVYDRSFSQDSDLLAPGQFKYLVFSGIDLSAIANSFNVYGEKFTRKYVEPIKYLSGGGAKIGFTKNLSIGASVAKDIMLREPTKLRLDKLQKLSSARIYRTGKSSSGYIAGLDIDFVPFDWLRFQSELGVSVAEAYTDPLFDPQGDDYGGFVSAEITKGNYHLITKLFSYGPDFYSPGSSNLSDQRGFKANASWKWSNVNFNGDIRRYYSNLDNFFSGGRSAVTDFSLSASGNIDKYSNIRAGIRSTGAKNDLFDDNDLTYDITIRRQLHPDVDFMINYARIDRHVQTPSSPIKTESINNRVNAELNYDAGKLGIIKFRNEMIVIDPEDRLIMAEIFDEDYFQETITSKNIRFVLDRSNLPIKGFTFSPNVGYRYGGDNKGFIAGLNLGYRFKSGRQVSLNYAYNSTFGRYRTGAVSFGGSKSHTVSLNFSDSLDFGLPRLSEENKTYRQTFDVNAGIIKGSVFVDLNENGIRDKDEEGVPDIDIKVQNLYTLTTDNKGNYIAPNVPAGMRKLAMEKYTLPVIYSPLRPSALVNVKPQKVYTANFAVLVTPGSVSGNIQVNKGNYTNRDVVVVVYDTSGKEVKYTSTDSQGDYYIESIPAGDYFVKIDKDFLDYRGLETEFENSKPINIPLVLDDFVDIENIDFTLIPKGGKARK